MHIGVKKFLQTLSNRFNVLDPKFDTEKIKTNKKMAVWIKLGSKNGLFESKLLVTPILKLFYTYNIQQTVKNLEEGGVVDFL